MLLKRTTILRRLIVPLFVFLFWTPAAYGWSWPVQGAVTGPFEYDESHPYAAGQHRGIDISAGATGDTVRAPADGTVSFAGTVPTNGKTVTIETPDGYSVTLTHLGTLVVAKGATVAEGDAVGTVGPSGTPEVDAPYVHLGIRVEADPNGYVDPLTLLPQPAATGGSDAGSTATQPVASGGASSSTAPASQPAPAPPASAPAAGSAGTIVQASPAPVAHHGRGHRTRTDTRSARSFRDAPASHPAHAERRVEHHPRLPHRHVSGPVSTSRRPVVEAAAPEPSGLGAGHESPSGRPTYAEPPLQPLSPALLTLACNGAAALVAVAAAIAAARRRRYEPAGEHGGAEVIRLPPRTLEPRERRAA